MHSGSCNLLSTKVSRSSAHEFEKNSSKDKEIFEEFVKIKLQNWCYW